MHQNFCVRKCDGVAAVHSAWWTPVWYCTTKHVWRRDNSSPPCGPVLSPLFKHKVKSIICYLSYAEKKHRASKDLSLVPVSLDIYINQDNTCWLNDCKKQSTFEAFQLGRYTGRAGMVPVQQCPSWHFVIPPSRSIVQYFSAYCCRTRFVSCVHSINLLVLLGLGASGGRGAM